MGAEVASSFESIADIAAGGTYVQICSLLKEHAVGRVRRAVVFDGMCISNQIIDIYLDVGETIGGPWHNFHTATTAAGVGYPITYAAGVPIRIPGFYFRATFENTNLGAVATNLLITGLLGVL